VHDDLQVEEFNTRLILAIKASARLAMREVRGQGQGRGRGQGRRGHHLQHRERYTLTLVIVVIVFVVCELPDLCLRVQSSNDTVDL